LTVIECGDVPGSYPSPGVHGWEAMVVVVDDGGLAAIVVVDGAARGLLLLQPAASATHANAMPQVIGRILHV
jgi:hypothetical protein